MICSSETTDSVKIPCISNNIGYQLKYDTCINKDKIQIYEGESFRSAKIRNMLENLNSKKLTVYFSNTTKLTSKKRYEIQYGNHLKI